MADTTKGEDGLSIPSQTLQQVREEYATRRRQFKKTPAQLAGEQPLVQQIQPGLATFQKY
ncbi:MAG: hypothetical protein U1D25_12150 [Hydrogenophaga sp.]|uniref:hypothetical protein n=1 Tax=Hydrogenophaga sp. TaxID=1904254 RepID=UPI002AB9364E|nr:hypothetical protein [Hydrogenophaga sp.]MDZ4188842.1 hypothetical protein [Hydrogenophaga sp.]